MDFFFSLEIEAFLINSEKGIKADFQFENSWGGRVLKNLYSFTVNLAVLLMVFWELNIFT